MNSWPRSPWCASAKTNQCIRLISWTLKIYSSSGESVGTFPHLIFILSCLCDGVATKLTTFSVSLWSHAANWCCTFHGCIIDVDAQRVCVICMLQRNLQIWRKQKSFSCAECCMICYTAVVARNRSVETSAGGEQMQSYIWKALAEMKTGVGVGGREFSNARGERASLQQKADAGRFTLHRITGWPGYHLHTTWGALYADRSNRTEEEEVVGVGGGGGGNGRWLTEGVKKRAVSACWRLVVRGM